MAYNSKLSTPQIEQALGAALLNEKNQYNITQDKGSNYPTLAEAIAAVSDDKYKVNGIVLTYNTGKEWVSMRYNGEDASGFADEGNWIDVGGAVGGTQYLDLSMFSEESGTLSDEDYQKVVKAYEDGINIFKDTILLNSDYIDEYFYGDILFKDSNYFINSVYNGLNLSGVDLIQLIILVQSDKNYSLIKKPIQIINTGSGTKALTDNGKYAEFAKPTKVESGGRGNVTKQLSPNTFYKFGEVVALTITFAAEKSGILNEYMFEFVSGRTATTLSVPSTVKWSGGSAPTIEANKTYQVSIVNNLAVYAAF